MDPARRVAAPALLIALTLGIAGVVGHVGAARAVAAGGPAPSAASAPHSASAGADEAVVVAAGDIGVCDGDGDEATAALVERIPGTVLSLGDQAYPGGTARDFRRCYAPSWGRFRGRTRPTPGNHEYFVHGAEPYFDYFGAAAGPSGLGWYSFELGGWHVVSLNSNADADPGSPQERWLREDLERHRGKCTLAFWHHARYSSGEHGDFARVAPLWQALHEAGAAVVVQAHDHSYERFGRMDAWGHEAADGIRSFVVGTGGANLHPFARQAPGSRVRMHHEHGVLRLALRPDSYAWEFIPVGGYVVDRGESACRADRG